MKTGIEAIEKVGGWDLSFSCTNETDASVLAGEKKPAEFRRYKNLQLGIELRVRRSLAKEGLDFLPGMVVDIETEKDLWNFFDEKFKGLGYVVSVGDELVIALVDLRKGEVAKVIPIADLPKMKRVVVDGVEKTIGGRNIFKMIDLKHEVASTLSRHLLRKVKGVLTEEELAANRKVIEATRKMEERERAEKRAAREARLKEIKSREVVRGVAIENGKGSRHAIPIVENEIVYFGPKDGMVAVVSGFNEDGSPVIPEDGILEAFFVHRRKGGGAPLKKGRVMVRLNGYEKKAVVEDSAVNLGVLRTILFQLPKSWAEELDVVAGFHEAYLTNRQGFTALRKAGLNSGTFVAIPDPSGSERIQVERMMGEETQTIGLFEAFEV